MRHTYVGVSQEHTTLIDQVIRQNLTYLDYSALLDLAEAVTSVESERVNGIIVEAGCALGGSALVMPAAKNSSLSVLATRWWRMHSVEKFRAVRKGGEWACARFKSKTRPAG